MYSKDRTCSAKRGQHTASPEVSLGSMDYMQD